MSENVKAGYGGSVKIAAVGLVEVGEWSADFGANLVKTPRFGKAWETNAATTKQGSGSFVLDVSDTDTKQADIRNAAMGGTLVEDLRLYEDSTHYYHGNAWIKIKVSAKADADVVKMTAEFTCDDTWVYV